MTDRQTARHRNLCENILQRLRVLWMSNADAWLLSEHVYRGFQLAHTSVSEEAISSAISDLCERGLVESRLGDVPGLTPQREYRITTDGRDFVQHGHPWDLMDRFAKRD
jgi:DNA-binding PadR family transcriptional regulator